MGDVPRACSRLRREIQSNSGLISRRRRELRKKFKKVRADTVAHCEFTVWSSNPHPTYTLNVKTGENDFFRCVSEKNFVTENLRDFHRCETKIFLKNYPKTFRDEPEFNPTCNEKN